LPNIRSYLRWEFFQAFFAKGENSTVLPSSDYSQIGEIYFKNAS